MSIAIAIVIAVFLLIWAVARWHLNGPDLSTLDAPKAEHFDGDPDSAAGQAVLARVRHLRATTLQAPLAERIQAGRDNWDKLFADQVFDTRFVPAQASRVAAEWVIPPDADASRRTLYIHGGGYVGGSAVSHRPLTTALARLTGGVVLAINYRLMPEHPRIAGFEDCQSAYRWLLEHAPDAAGQSAPASDAQRIFVAGDSAGGNLALALIAWIRDTGLRAPDAAVALSPQTDSTVASPSLRRNLASDPMLGPIYQPYMKVPRTLILWMAWLHTRINPRHPMLSPVFGNLANLPPVLVQASESEMLLDDARRYAARAQAAGSPVRLQTWSHMVHVWQLFNPELPEANQALEEIGRFLAAAGRRD